MLNFKGILARLHPLAFRELLVSAAYGGALCTQSALFVRDRPIWRRGRSSGDRVLALGERLCRSKRDVVPPSDLVGEALRVNKSVNES